MSGVGRFRTDPAFCRWLRIAYYVAVLRALACFAVASIVGVVFAATPAASVAPPGQNHAWNVALSNTALSSHPDITATLNLCTDGTGLPGIAHECLSGIQPSPLFDHATVRYTGMRVAASAIASRIATIALDVETNLGLAQSVGNDAGQPALCGSLVHTSVAAVDIWAAATTGATVSMDPSSAPGFAYDQLDDPAQADPTIGATEGDGWPMGISRVPSVVPDTLTALGLPASALVSRGYGVIHGLQNTTVTLMTVFTGTTQGTDAVSTIIVLGNPYGAQDPAKADVMNCTPFSSALTLRGTTIASAGSKTINGATVSGDYSPAAAAGQTLQTICDATLPAQSACNPSARTVSLLLSTAGDDDGDGVADASDDCPTVADPAQSSFAGIGDACGGALGVNAGLGYDNNASSAIAAFAAASCSGLPHSTANAMSCTDVDGDGIKNASDNCPFVANAMQQNRDGDSRGDACEGDGADPGLTGSGTNSEAFTPGDFTGGYRDFDDRCDAAYNVGGALSLTATCSSFTSVPGPGGCCTGPGTSFADANDDGVPDYLLVASIATRDHRGDANGDGYSDADEGSPVNCGVASCGNLTTYATAETPSCSDAGRHCGTIAVSPVGAPRVAAGGAGLGCWRSIDSAGALRTTALAKSDVDLDGVVSILDITTAASWFGDHVGGADDPRWEGNFDGDGVISILDLGAMASNIGRSVSAGCATQ